jgi:transaldolase
MAPFAEEIKTSNRAICNQKKGGAKLNQLDQLKEFTTIVADTGDFETIREFEPKDATTNPSLIYAATQKENYSHFLEEVLAKRKKSGLSGAAQIEDIIEHLLVGFGCAILGLFRDESPPKPTRASLSMWQAQSRKRGAW